VSLSSSETTRILLNYLFYLIYFIKNVVVALSEMYSLKLEKTLTILYLVNLKPLQLSCRITVNTLCNINSIYILICLTTIGSWHLWQVWHLWLVYYIQSTRSLVTTKTVKTVLLWPATITSQRNVKFTQITFLKRCLNTKPKAVLFTAMWKSIMLHVSHNSRTCSQQIVSPQ
jgi:hypothetical protein